MTERIDLPKTYEASTIEDALYSAWEKSGVFNPNFLPDRNQKGEPYCIMMPPPNRTGTLHMGHAEMLAIQDLMIRFQRMQGKKAVWIPGTDHAAIATQIKVEQLLIKEGMKDPRRELGREAFLERVKAFAEDSKETINRQVRKMGSSCDWSREKYTFDAERNRAVNEMFARMYQDGIIERGDRLVNWDPKFKTVISDDEIVWVEEQAQFYTFKYGPFEIGTARPETKFGDKYVVMHPDDPRYAQYKHGQKIEVEWINGPITATILKDAVVDREFGTGAMTITPWHDAIDYDLAERWNLDKQQIIDMDGKLLPIAGEFAGLPILEARKKVVEKLKNKGLLVKVDENYTHRVATAERGGELIEPQISRQWFIRVNKPFALRQNTLGKWKMGEKATLKELMRYAVESGQTKMIPERFDKTYFHWIDNLRDWCISRQIWFGHQIPVWYRGDEMQATALSPGKDWQQDPDTLDTWFSSGSWTFSTLGWPDTAHVDANGDLQKTGELALYHPTSLLETGYDIIFFWVARMVLMTTYALGEVPFKDAYLHGLVRDEQGRKMSKSLGNILDPLDLIPKYGTDAVRLSLLIGGTPGQDMKLSETKIESFRNFTNKLWNISRFILLQIDANEAGMTNTLADQWIKTRLEQVVSSVTKKLETYQFSSAGEELRDFTWSDLADWYLEIAKVEKGKSEILKDILQTILKLWHPFMPFVTEHVWQIAGFKGQLIIAEWPNVSATIANNNLFSFEELRQLITDGRRLRAEQGIDAGKQIEFSMVVGENKKEYFIPCEDWIKRLLNASALNYTDALPSNWVVTNSGVHMIGFDPAGAIDVEKERTKAQKELDEVEKYLVSLQAKLENQEFVGKAPERVVQDMKKKQEEALLKKTTLEKRLQELG